MENDLFFYGGCIERNTQNPDKPDQDNMAVVLRGFLKNKKLRAGEIPYTECCIFDRKPSKSACIIHYQASRKYKNMIRNPRIATREAKRAYPKKPSKSLGPFVELQWLMIKSRRGGLTDKEIQHYISIIELNIEEISKWHERWLCSIFDTLGENGHPIFLVLSAIRLMEKFNKPVLKPKNQFARTATIEHPDIHENLARRLAKNLEGWGFTIPIIYSLLEQINKDPDSILGRFTSLTGNSISRQMIRKIKDD